MFFKFIFILNINAEIFCKKIREYIRYFIAKILFRKIYFRIILVLLIIPQMFAFKLFVILFIIFAFMKTLNKILPKVINFKLN